MKSLLKKSIDPGNCTQYDYIHPVLHKMEQPENQEENDEESLTKPREDDYESEDSQYFHEDKSNILQID